MAMVGAIAAARLRNRDGPRRFAEKEHNSPLGSISACAPRSAIDRDWLFRETLYDAVGDRSSSRDCYQSMVGQPESQKRRVRC